MRFFRILALNSQHVLQHRMRSLVWFFMTAITPVVVIMFWIGALKESGGEIGSWNLNDFASYYILIIVANNFLIIHIQEHVGNIHIKQGNLSGFLIRPISYFWAMFLYELPYRLLQVSYGLIAIFIIMPFLNVEVVVDVPAHNFFPTVLVIFCALMISFTFKMIFGICAFWITRIDGIQHSSFVMELIFGGFTMPLELFPPFMKIIGYLTPYPWISYFPVRALQGGYGTLELYVIVLCQLIWIILLGSIYRFMWRRGIRKYTGVGQ